MARIAFVAIGASAEVTEHDTDAFFIININHMYQVPIRWLRLVSWDAENPSNKP